MTANYERAACIGADPELFFPDKGESGAAAKAICRGCPIKNACLEDNLLQQHGIHGGLTPNERLEVRRSRGVVYRRIAAAADGVRAACGSTAGYHQHQYRRETPCRPCLDAKAEYRRIKRIEKQQDAA